MTELNDRPAVVSNPYAHAFEMYLAAGWTSPLPLPLGKKYPPPQGFTGRAALVPSYADCYTWADGSDGPKNIALWPQRGIMGLDVDAYADKVGGETLRTMVSELGPLPMTILSTSRGDGISGIRPYRVPPDIEFVPGLDGIDICQPSVRYMTVWPSIHPEGRAYQWINELNGQVIDGVPNIDDIPWLPQPWIDALTRVGSTATKVEASTSALRAMLDAMPTIGSCACLDRYADKYFDDTESGRSHHDAAMDATLAILGAGRRGCPGAKFAVETLFVHFARGIASRASTAEAAVEYSRLVDGALAILAGVPQGEGCEEMRVAEWVASLPDDFPVNPVAASDGLRTETGDPNGTEIEKRFPTLNWAELWADDSTERWFAEPLIAEGRLTAIYSPPKVGKSLLMLEIAAGIATGRSIFGYPKQTPAMVLYVDFENDPRGDIRTRLQAMGYEPADLVNLKYLSFPTLSALDTEKGSEQLMAVADHHVAKAIVIDTISRAVQGEENDNDTWLAFYRHTGIKVKQRGMSLVRLDHSGKDVTKGQRGGSAKSGDVDSVWRLSAVDVERGIYRLECEARRFQFSETKLTLVRKADPLRHEVDESTAADVWKEKVAACVVVLDALDVDQMLGKRKAWENFTKKHGHSERVTETAQKSRRERAAQSDWLGE